MWMKPVAYMPARAAGGGEALVVPPEPGMHKGGPVYNQLRANFAYFRRMWVRHPFRWLIDNWDYDRAAMLNVPEISLEPRKNQWMYHIDGPYWDGIMGRVFQDSMLYLLLYPFTGWMLYAMYYRAKLNNKFAFLTKWRED